MAVLAAAAAAVRPTAVGHGGPAAQDAVHVARVRVGDARRPIIDGAADVAGHHILAKGAGAAGARDGRSARVDGRGAHHFRMTRGAVGQIQRAAAQRQGASIGQLGSDRGIIEGQRAFAHGGAAGISVVASKRIRTSADFHERHGRGAVGDDAGVTAPGGAIAAHTQVSVLGAPPLFRMVPPVPPSVVNTSLRPLKSNVPLLTVSVLKS